MKILIFSASTGGGHKRAAAALKSKINRISPETSVTVVDAMETIGRVYNKTVCNGYRFMATKIPRVYGACYKATDRKTLMYRAVMNSNTLVSNKLLETLELHSPDVVIICHPFVTAMISNLKQQGKTDARIISIVTDYAAHRTYITPNIDAYVLAEPQMEEKLVREYGVDRDILYPLGIPISDKFTEPYDRAELRRREGLDPNLPTVLMMAGSFGVVSVLDFYRQLAARCENTQMIVIAGNNRRLYEALKRTVSELNGEGFTKLLGFVENVEDYMHASDLIITKPGGLTVTESLACGLPLAVYNSFPGQELDNAEFLIRAGAAVRLDKSDGANQINGLLGDKKRLAEMKKQCEGLAIKNSAEKIFMLAEKLYGVKDERSPKQ